MGAAAGVKRYLDEAERPQSVEDARKVLAEVSRLAPDSPLAELILGYYRMIADGCTLADLRREADAVKAASLKDII